MCSNQEGAGWVKIFRSMLSWEWYKDTNTTRLFLHLLLKANFKKNCRGGMTVPGGALSTSVGTLSKETGLTRQEIRTCLNRLCKSGEISCATNNRHSIITVVNYENYQNQQADRLATDSVPEPKQETAGNQRTLRPDTPCAGSSVDVNKYNLDTFFGVDNMGNLEQLVMSLHRVNPKTKSIQDMRCLAEEVVAEWNITKAEHTSYKDWSSHLINQIRIKNKSYGNKNNRPDDSGDAGRAEKQPPGYGLLGHRNQKTKAVFREMLDTDMP